MRALAIGLLGIVLVNGTAFAQTPLEQARILDVFKQSVADYTVLNQCTDPVPPIFTPPVATVFRQLIATALEGPADMPQLTGAGTVLPLDRHPAALEPFPAAQLHDFPARLERALPALPPMLEYRLIGDDLVLRDVRDEVIVAVLRNAVGGVATTRR
jgi:hypothetical protein